jgi:hypothetical protein
VEHLIAYGKVDDGGQQDADPYGDVIGEYAKRVPLVTDPAPQLLEQLN